MKFSISDITFIGPLIGQEGCIIIRVVDMEDSPVGPVIVGPVDEARVRLAVKTFVEATEGIAITGFAEAVAVNNKTAKSLKVEQVEVLEGVPEAAAAEESGEAESE